MSQQGLDLRRSMQIMLQHKILMAILVSLGVLGGVAYTVLEPPMVTSTAQIALPNTIAAATFTATQEVVVDSYQVLSGALPNVQPAMSIIKLRHYVQVTSPSALIISVTAEGKNAASAEATANAVVGSYIRYVTSSRSAVGRVQARVLSPATVAGRPSWVKRTIVFLLLGGLAGALIGAVVALAIGRNDRRLRQRDEIANSIGIPVIASIQVAHPSAAAGWTKLFEEYKPTAAPSWQMRVVLDQLDVGRPGFSRTASSNGDDPLYEDHAAAYDRGSSVTVVSLASDPGALGLGPQLAIFAASQGIPTSLVVGPQQGMAATASLRIACATPISPESRRRGLLRVASYEQGGVELRPDTALVVVVAVVDSRAPEMPDTPRTSATLIGVSAGAATAEQLARAAVAASADGREISGILVANPLETDQTSGRIPRLARSARPKLPNRLRGIATEIRR